jgi:hypothetical protein
MKNTSRIMVFLKFALLSQITSLVTNGSFIIEQKKLDDMKNEFIIVLNHFTMPEDFLEKTWDPRLPPNWLFLSEIQNTEVKLHKPSFQVVFGKQTDLYYDLENDIIDFNISFKWKDIEIKESTDSGTATYNFKTTADFRQSFSNYDSDLHRYENNFRVTSRTKYSKLEFSGPKEKESIIDSYMKVYAQDIVNAILGDLLQIHFSKFYKEKEIFQLVVFPIVNQKEDPSKSLNYTVNFRPNALPERINPYTLIFYYTGDMNDIWVQEGQSILTKPEFRDENGYQIFLHKQLLRNYIKDIGRRTFEFSITTGDDFSDFISFDINVGGMSNIVPELLNYFSRTTKITIQNVVQECDLYEGEMADKGYCTIMTHIHVSPDPEKGQQERIYFSFKTQIQYKINSGIDTDPTKNLRFKLFIDNIDKLSCKVEFLWEKFSIIYPDTFAKLFIDNLNLYFKPFNKEITAHPFDLWKEIDLSQYFSMVSHYGFVKNGFLIGGLKRDNIEQPIEE